MVKKILKTKSYESNNHLHELIVEYRVAKKGT
jgi:hypothetical protein